MCSAWSELRTARIQVALESILLKKFSSNSEALERQIIQSKEFRSLILPAWANYCIKSSRAFTDSNVSELTKLRLPSGLSHDTIWFIDRLKSHAIKAPDSKPAFPLELSLSGPKFPFSPRHLYHLQRKTDTLNGRELTHRLPVKPSSAPELPASSTRRVSRKQRRDQLKEYQWRVADDDDNLQEDLLSPKYSSF